MDQPTDLSLLVDRQSGEIIQIRQKLAEKPPEEFVAIPWALQWDLRLKAGDTKLYSLFVYLAQGHGGIPFELPPQRDLVKILKWNQNRLGAAQKRLHTAGWITIMNLGKPGKRERFRIVVKHVVQEISNRMNATELTEIMRGWIDREVRERFQGLMNQYGGQLDITLIIGTWSSPGLYRGRSFIGGALRPTRYGRSGRHA